ncbi:hypothetical protein NC651_033146 [Populus alba x Populus x berolinensis]|nr:hypothetical protein NC651_033146 [Populus alba x Populus x berolinensis]
MLNKRFIETDGLETYSEATWAAVFVIDGVQWLPYCQSSRRSKIMSVTDLIQNTANMAYWLFSFYKFLKMMSPHKYTRAHDERQIRGVIGFHYAKEEKVVPLAALLMVSGEKLITPVTHPRAKMVLLI